VERSELAVEGVLDGARVSSGRARRKLASLKQLNRKTSLREVSGRTDTDDPAADDRDVNAPTDDL